MSLITVVPFGGLGNRLRVLQSALQVAEENDSNLKLLWFKKSELRAHFFELFQNNDKRLLEKVGFQYELTKLFLKHIYTVKYPKLYKLVLRLFYDCVILDEDILNGTQDVIADKIGKSQNVLIATCYQFQNIDNYNNFRPLEEIDDLAESFIQRIERSSQLIGVHIRRTDHIDIVKLGGIEVYQKEIDGLLASDPDSKFLICSDDQEVKRKLKEVYGDSVVTREVELSRANKTGMIEALVDILLLSKCNILIGSERSSFVTLAQKFGTTKDLIDIENA